MGTRYWLMKSEPGEFSLEDLKNAPERTDHWDGVRNYKARNYLRDMQVGDRVLFYHSGKNPAAVGTARVVRAGYPDPTAWDPESAHFDAKSSPDKPIWTMVDVQFESEFPSPVLLKTMREAPELEGMILLRRGNRLSVFPVTREEFEAVVAMGRKH